jgi:sugar-phosphatase
VSAFLFDLDGVLVDSTLVVERAWRRWAFELNLSSADVISSIHGRRSRDVIRSFLPEADVDEHACRIARLESSEADDLQVFAGARECLDFASSLRWAVVTSGARQIAEHRLGAVGLPVPATLVTGDDVSAGKPDPEPFLRASESLGVLPFRCIVVEDSPAGIAAGNRAGMTTIAVTTTHSSAALREADVICVDMVEVLKQMRQLCSEWN